MVTKNDFLKELYGSDLTPSAKIIGSLFYSFNLFGEQSPSYKEISERINFHKNTAISGVRELVTKGYILKKTDHAKRKNYFSVPYELPSSERQEELMAS